MDKHEFIAELRLKLSGLPESDVDERLNFYSEMIDDRSEEGLSEEEAVKALGSVDDIVSQILSETSFVKIAKERIAPKRKLAVWEIVLLVLGSPIWLSLIVAAVAVCISIYVSVWAVIISFWAVFGSLAGCFAGSIIQGAVYIINYNVFEGIALFGVGITCAGLSMFVFVGCKRITSALASLTKKMALIIKRCFVGKEEK